MVKSIRSVVLLAIAAVLAACATPRYETTYRHEPPVGAEGAACAQRCEAALDTCRTDCRAAWQACTAGVEPQVDERYAQALREYAEDLRSYRRMLEQYQWDVWTDWDYGYRGMWYSPWRVHVPLPMPPGDPPTREAVRDGLRNSRCKDDCGCLVRYDACFEACGGKVVSETHCVANCPPGK